MTRFDVSGDTDSLCGGARSLGSNRSVSCGRAEELSDCYRRYGRNTDSANCFLILYSEYSCSDFSLTVEKKYSSVACLTLKQFCA